MRTGCALGALMMMAPAPLMAEWQVAAYLGAARTLSSDLTVSQPALGNAIRFSPVPYRGESFRSPVYYGYRAGWFLNPHLGFDAEFIHLKAYARVDRPAVQTGTLGGRPVSATAPIETVVSRFNMSHGVNLLLGNVVYRRDLVRRPGERLGRLLLTARFGAGTTIPHVESTILGQAEERYQSGGFAWQVAAGPEYLLWRRLYGLAEYKFTHAGARVDIPSGTAETSLNTHHVVFGLGWHF